MRRHLRLHYLFVLVGLAIGLTAGVFWVEFEPAFVAWIVCSGLGITGGAYLAAITSGEALAGGGNERRGNWTLNELYGSEDGLPVDTRENGHGPH